MKSNKRLLHRVALRIKHLGGFHEEDQGQKDAKACTDCLASFSKAGVFEMTVKASEKVEVSATELSNVRNALIEAKNGNDDVAFAKAVADFDTALKKLGVAQEALEKVKAHVWDKGWGGSWSVDTTWNESGEKH